MLNVLKKTVPVITIILIVCLALVYCAGTYAQETMTKELWQKSYKFDQQLINSINDKAYTNLTVDNISGVSNSSSHGIAALRNSTKRINQNLVSAQVNKNGLLSSDTLIIGIPPNDSLVISGNFSYSGTIIVALNGRLIFRNASAKIAGDIILFNNAQMIADSSYLYFPQQYFYQRMIFATGKSKVQVTNSTFDFSNLSHTLVSAGNSEIFFRNIINKGFTTTGLYGQGKISIDKANEAGEFVLTDTANLAVNNASTVLIWHQTGNGAKFNIQFPSGDSLSSYDCSNSSNGISGINFKVHLGNCKNVMWGLMPSNGSDITIRDSKLRTVGIWFKGNLQSNLNSLVNNSIYDNFTLPIDSIKLKLINTSVDTWSLYPMDYSNINVSGCIVGEVGAEQHSSIVLSKTFCDGSGGYLWGTDTTFSVIGFSTATTSVRSQGNAVVIFSHSAMIMGQASATQNSVMMVLQSTLPEEPKAFDNGCVWYGIIDGPSSGNTDSKVKITGSAWIYKTQTSHLMNYDHYKLFYRRTDSDPWLPITSDQKNQVHNDTLAVWDTKGLPPDNYRLRLMLVDNFGDSVDAITTINILPAEMSISDIKANTTVECYPNPVTNRLNVKILGFEQLQSYSIFDISGHLISYSVMPFNYNCDFDVNTEDFCSGNYFLVTDFKTKRIITKFAK